MAVTIRLSRHGQTHRPFYHVVAADSRMRRDGRYLEKLGTYNPMGNKELNIDNDKARKWVGHGATMSGAVRSLLKQAGVFSAPVATEEAPAEASAE